MLTLRIVSAEELSSNSSPPVGPGFTTSAHYPREQREDIAAWFTERRSPRSRSRVSSGIDVIAARIWLHQRHSPGAELLRHQFFVNARSKGLPAVPRVEDVRPGPSCSLAPDLGSQTPPRSKRSNSVTAEEPRRSPRCRDPPAGRMPTIRARFHVDSDDQRRGQSLSPRRNEPVVIRPRIAVRRSR